MPSVKTELYFDTQKEKQMANTGADSNALQGKFIQVADLGIMTVPESYDPVNALSLLRENPPSNVRYVNLVIGDRTYGNPTRVLRPGERFWVRVHQIVDQNDTNTAEYLEYLASLNSYLPGIQGGAVVLQEKQDLLPSNLSFMLVDADDRLFVDHGNRNGEGPFVCELSYDVLAKGWKFLLKDKDFNYGMYDNELAIFSYCDPPNTE